MPLSTPHFLFSNPLTQSPLPSPSSGPTEFNLYNVDAVFCRMVQENVALLAHHAGTSVADRRAHLRDNKFTTLRQGLKESFSVPLMPERPRKGSRDSRKGPSEEVLADRLHNKRADFARSHGKAQLCIAA